MDEQEKQDQRAFAAVCKFVEITPFAHFAQNVQ